MRKENQMSKELEKMKFMKKMVDYMRSESIISTLRAKRLKKDIQKWWFIKSNQSDKMRDAKRVSSV